MTTEAIPRTQEALVALLAEEGKLTRLLGDHRYQASQAERNASLHRAKEAACAVALARVRDQLYGPGWGPLAAIDAGREG